MLKSGSVKQLSAMSTPKMFMRGQYICYEGEPGKEMYIIIRGTVGVYVSDASEQLTEIARLGNGEIFGEMSVLDDLPRSASCIAVDDVVCVSVSKESLGEIINACPDVAMMLLESMSRRLRRMDNEIYKGKSADPADIGTFVFPKEYSYSHNVEEPSHSDEYVQDIDFSCPICGKNITVSNLKKYVMTHTEPDKTGQIRFNECDHLWYDIWNCPHCGYSNYYRSFFNIPDAAKEAVREIDEKTNAAARSYLHLIKTPFDYLVLCYLRAIHINRVIAADNYELSGRLWLDLYYLCSDAQDSTMAMYFGRNAAEQIERAVHAGSIEDDKSLRLLALSAADIFAQLGNKKSASEMCDVCIAGTYADIAEYASRIRECVIG